MFPDTVLYRIRSSGMVLLLGRMFQDCQVLRGSISLNLSNLKFPRFSSVIAFVHGSIQFTAPFSHRKPFIPLSAGFNHSLVQLCSSLAPDKMLCLDSHTFCHFGDSFRCSLPRSGFVRCSSIQLIEIELASLTLGIAVLCLRGCVSTIVFSVSRVSSARVRRQAASAWACQRGQLLGSFRLHRC